jgi:isoleucyl-tRNA synthetase
VKDTTVVAQFRVVRNETSEFLFGNLDPKVYILAWTTTPWTLPSNTALCVGPAITYVKVRTYNPYSAEPVTLILAKELLKVYFDPKNETDDLGAYQPGDKRIPYFVVEECTGAKLAGVHYEQLIDWVRPREMPSG